MTCGCSSVGDAAERQFSQKKAAKDLARYHAKGPESTTRLLLAGLTKAGPLYGRLLDVGSGIGALTFELLERGVTDAVGVDLSSAHVETASKEASQRSQSDSTRFVQVISSTSPVNCRPPTSSLSTESSVVIRNSSGCSTSRCATQTDISLFPIQGTCGTSGRLLDSTTWVDRSLRIRFDHSSIQCLPWSK
jgi:hypothetical protein